MNKIHRLCVKKKLFKMKPFITYFKFIPDYRNLKLNNIINDHKLLMFIVLLYIHTYHT